MNKKVAYFIDTFFEINGVAKTSQALFEQCAKESRNFKFITSYPDNYNTTGLYNFKPMVSIPLPYYPELKINICNFFKALAFCRQEKFDILYAPTPGILGLYALLIAKILKLPLVSAFHTDFGAYMQKYTGSEMVGNIARTFLRQTYNRSTRVLCPSKIYKNILIKSGVNSDIIQLFSRGANKRQFCSSYKDKTFWNKYIKNYDDAIIALYVGRISDEKNVSLFAEIAEYFLHANVRFVMVGDGPARKKLQDSSNNVYFTGFLTGEPLSIAYASSDIFLFPSETETFGNVVLEACASGICPVVSSLGASSEHIKHTINGFVATTFEDYVNTLENLFNNPKLLQSAREEAFRSVENVDSAQLFSLMLDLIELKTPNKI